MAFSRQEYWRGLPCPPPGDLPHPGVEPPSPSSLALAGKFFTTEPPGKPVVFVSIWPIILFLFSQLTGPWTLGKTGAQLSAKMDSTTETCGCMSTPIMEWDPHFLTRKKPSCACADREVFLDLRGGHLILLLQQISAPATSFVLGVSG